ncbi:MAG: tetratricopeptide repeat protein [Armatimonadetes bacterium]|nr:tetratricopeptide repeat protein [Armatimonadota bacterium]MDI9600813.1 tetratricopeptide repeat protein [Acidobacteriota bacterium]NLN90667.1 tetratricopeptide repeat protein [candidate division WS1 bacterium]
MYPDHVDEAFDQAERLRESGNYASARALYLLVLEEWPDYAPAHVGLSVCTLHLGRIEDALSDLRRAVDLDPGNPAYRTDLAHALNTLGRYGEARREMRRARRDRIEGDKAR